ncbi:hypothetical protein KR093_010825 [Drosophila rubida]|uniref:DUF229 domain containing protein n=1 Tax=Drosophila rubida TaxID=30044 RepID=A0AAD4PPQ9_9MUSC|nr:hypothetical protein KR093_010825 [Drosophila rubida]
MKKQNRKYTKATKKVLLICLVAIVICVLLYFKINAVLLRSANRDHFMEGYFVNTSGCHMLALNPFSKTALAYFGHVEPITCSKFKLFDAKTINGKNYLELAMSTRDILEKCEVKRVWEVRCEYRRVKRYNDNSNKYSHPVNFQLTHERVEVKRGHRILRIQCFGGANKSVYHDVHFFVPPPKRNKHRVPRGKRLSVMILGIDSLSHMHYLRTMPLLDAYIESLLHVEFWGFNRIGRNTYPNLVPLFTGLSDVELEEKCYKGKHSYDACDFIWKRFKARGYKTSYAEDSFIGGTFNYGKWGFEKAPTDFYLRPAMLEIDRYCRYSVDKQQDIYCTGGRKYSDVLHEFIFKLIPHFKNGPHFSFFWHAQGMHDYYEYAQFIDKQYEHLLHRLKAESVLKNTFVFLMSDHGLRFGPFRATYQGMVEESQPLFIAIYPKWFADKYPLAVINLQKNAQRLITTFDMHETLKDILNLNQLQSGRIENRTKTLQSQGNQMPRGISLFLPIPEIRDCKLAGIPSTFCLCNGFRPMDVTDAKSEQAAHFVVQSINKWIAGYRQCKTIRLAAIREAYLLNIENSDFNSDFEVKVRVQTMPGEGRFEGIVRFMRGGMMLNGPVLRTNKYGNQSHCIQDFHIEMYCHCL